MPSWKAIAAAKRAENMAKIPSEWRLPDEILNKAKEQRDITGDFIESLLDNATLCITGREPLETLTLLTNGTLTAVEVVTAYCKRAAVAHQLNQNLLEMAFDSAIERAKELDNYYKQHHRIIGPLHGLPFTVKDQWHMKGVDTSMAYVGWVGTQAGRQRPNKEGDLESELILEMNRLGAVPIAKTTLMQTLWYGETNNNILGYSWNPHIQTLSSGGSSGGEATLQALKGSAFGFGTDIGGSVSMPTAFNKIYSLKPSHGRISFRATANSSSGQMIIPTVVGILARSLETIHFVFESLLSTEPWLRNPEVLPIPFRASIHDEYSKLAVGIFPSDGIVKPHPPVSRAIEMVKEALEAHGHQTIQWEPPNHKESAFLHPAFTEADGAVDVMERTALSGEPLVPEIQDEFTDAPDPIPVTEYYNLTMRLQDFRAAYAAYWASTQSQTSTGRAVDAFVMPVAPHAAPRPGKIYHYTYTSIINTLDYCSVVIPVTTANRRLDAAEKHYRPLNEVDRQTWEAYEPEKYDGAPVAVQIVGGRLNEENLLAVAKAVVKALRDYA
jgi:amidase